MESIVILLGGGDAGVLIITSDGVTLVDPPRVDVLQTVKAANVLSAAASRARGGAHEQILGKQSHEVGKLAMTLVNKELGRAADAPVMSFDEDGGWRCGSNGPTHIPIHWPKWGPTPDPGFAVADSLQAAVNGAVGVR